MAKSLVPLIVLVSGAIAVGTALNIATRSDACPRWKRAAATADALPAPPLEPTRHSIRPDQTSPTMNRWVSPDATAAAVVDRGLTVTAWGVAIGIVGLGVGLCKQFVKPRPERMTVAPLLEHPELALIAVPQEALPLVDGWSAAGPHDWAAMR